MKRQLAFCALCILFLGATGHAAPHVFFVCSEFGDVLRYDPTDGSIVPVGDLSAFSIVKVKGIAYDPETTSILILDASGENVYSMNAETGSASHLFATGGREFQGGAVKNGLLYGIDEVAQVVLAYSLADGTLVLQGTQTTPQHCHSTGIDRNTGQLYATGAEGAIWPIADDGTFGPTVVTNQFGAFYTDIDYLDGDFVATRWTQGIALIDAETGVVTEIVTISELEAVGGDGGGRDFFWSWGIVVAFTDSTITDVPEIELSNIQFAVGSPWPNPLLGAQGAITFPVSVRQAETISIEVYDARGRRILTSRPRHLSASGRHHLTLNVRGLPSGFYWARFSTASGQTATANWILAR